MFSNSTPSTEKVVKADRAKRVLSRVALFLGELRDGLTMINMQNAYLITSKYYTEKQAGLMFFVFGMSQFLAQTPAGYLMDYSDKKVMLLAVAAIGTTVLTLATAVFAQDYGTNLGFMIFIKILQGAITALIPPGLNSITQGIVGSVGMTSQVSMNEQMNHLGTAIIVLCGSLLAFTLYPDIGMLFIVSPIACAGVIYFLMQIQPGDIDHNAARGLKATSESTTRTESFDSSNIKPSPTKDGPIQIKPSFNLGFGSESKEADANSFSGSPKADTPLSILRDPILVIFVIICFTFHLSNGTVLPLVMQNLAIANGKAGILMSGFCIIIAQAFMVMSAKICGTYSGIYGRKGLFLIGLLSVPLRCAILTVLLKIKSNQYYGGSMIDYIVLSTQILDGVGAGIFGTMYVLVTSDISGGTGRFSLTLGLTTSAMSIGGTVSGYLGQAIAQDMGYQQAFMILGVMSLVPAVLYFFFMPETLSDDESGERRSSGEAMTGIAEGEESETPYGQLA
jgi:MFS family permease